MIAVHIRSEVLIMSPLRSVSTAFGTILQEESHTMMPQHSEVPSSAFYSMQEKQKSMVRLKYCHGSGRIKENCCKPLGYPPDHRLQKGNNIGENVKANKDWRNKGKLMGEASASLNPATEADSWTPLAWTGIFFSLEQYAAILKLLAKDNSST